MFPLPRFVQPRPQPARGLLPVMLLAIAVLLPACAVMANPAPAADKLPAWLAGRIATYEKGQFGSVPSEVWSYLVDGKPVYYIPAPCCDRFSELLDAKGQLICAPDGGISGKGDGKCAAAFKAPNRMDVVWQDPRRGLTVKPVDNTK